MTVDTGQLAIHGGPPVRTAPMPPRGALGPDERRLIGEVLDHYGADGSDPGYQGPFEERYTQAFAASLGGGYADAVATGTAALFVALKALDLPPGSEVLVSPVTDPGCLSAIILAGLVPRLGDSAPGGFGMGSDQVAARLGPATACVLVVHAFGRAVDVDRIVQVAHARGAKVLEDCSQAHGARLHGRPVGSFGDIAAFSTMYRKASITGASGGVVYTRDEVLYRKALAHADRGKPRWQPGFDDRDPSSLLFPALNLHTDEISCAIGLASLGRLEDTIARRRRFVAALGRTLVQESRHCRPWGDTEGDSPFVHPIFVDVDRLRCTKVEFAEAVRAEGIGLNPHYRYLARDWPWLRPYLADGFETASSRAALDQSFCLYLNENYGPDEVRDTVAAIAKVERYFARA
jgi:dTDP-4-amino-4,6-dideoxygalactose transaminase